MKGRNFGVSRCSSSELLLGRCLFRCGPVGVDHVREGALEAERDQIDDVDIERDEEAGRALVPGVSWMCRVNTLHTRAMRATGGQRNSPEGGRGERHGAADVHGVAEDVEGKALDAVVHEDAEIVAQEGASDTKSPGGCDDENLA